MVAERTAIASSARGVTPKRDRPSILRPKSRHAGAANMVRSQLTSSASSSVRSKTSRPATPIVPQINPVATSRRKPVRNLTARLALRTGSLHSRHSGTRRDRCGPSGCQRAFYELARDCGHKEGGRSRSPQRGPSSWSHRTAAFARWRVLAGSTEDSAEGPRLAPGSTRGVDQLTVRIPVVRLPNVLLASPLQFHLQQCRIHIHHRVFSSLHHLKTQYPTMRTCSVLNESNVREWSGLVAYQTRLRHA